METSVIYSKSNTFVEQNTTLDFILGIAALSLNLLDTLKQEELAGPGEIFSPNQQESEQISGRYLYFMLGLVATANRVVNILETEQNKTAAQKFPLDRYPMIEVSLSELQDLLR